MLLINHDYENLSYQETVDLCQRLDVRHRIFLSQQANLRPRTSATLQPRSMSAPLTPAVPRPSAPVEPATPISNEGTVPMDLSAGRPRGRLTEDEKQRRRDNGLCLYCGGGEHIARNCSHRPQARPIAMRTVGFGSSSTSTSSSPALAPASESENA
jgi:hypothetical protein